MQRSSHVSSLYAYWPWHSVVPGSRKLSECPLPQTRQLRPCRQGRERRLILGGWGPEDGALPPQLVHYRRVVHLPVLVVVNQLRHHVGDMRTLGRALLPRCLREARDDAEDVGVLMARDQPSAAVREVW